MYMDAVMKDVKVEIGRMGMRFLDAGREWRLPGLLYAHHFVLCGESEEDRKEMFGRLLMYVDV